MKDDQDVSRGEYVYRHGGVRACWHMEKGAPGVFENKG